MGKVALVAADARAAHDAPGIVYAGVQSRSTAARDVHVFMLLPPRINFDDEISTRHPTVAGIIQRGRTSSTTSYAPASSAAHNSRRKGTVHHRRPSSTKRAALQAMPPRGQPSTPRMMDVVGLIDNNLDSPADVLGQVRLATCAPRGISSPTALPTNGT